MGVVSETPPLGVSPLMRARLSVSLFHSKVFPGEPFPRMVLMT